MSKFEKVSLVVAFLSVVAALMSIFVTVWTFQTSIKTAREGIDATSELARKTALAEAQVAVQQTAAEMCDYAVKAAHGSKSQGEEPSHSPIKELIELGEQIVIRYRGIRLLFPDEVRSKIDASRIAIASEELGPDERLTQMFEFSNLLSQCIERQLIPEEDPKDLCAFYGHDVGKVVC